MKITGYRTLTEKERDYLTIHRLLRKHKLPIPEIAEFLNALIKKGFITLPDRPLQYDSLLPFCVVCDDSPDYTLRLDQLPENTVKLLIETK